MATQSNYSYKHENNHEIQHIRIYNASGDGFDLTQTFVKMSIMEDLQGGFIRAELILSDVSNIIETLGPYGEENISIKWSTRDEDFNMRKPVSITFRVQSWGMVPDIEQLNRAGVKFTLVSPYEIQDDKIKLSRSYVGITGSQFVNRALDILEYDGPRNIEDTLHERDFICPNLSPIQMIEFFTRVSQSKQNGSGDYYFFQNLDGINFVTIDSLMENEPEETLVLDEDVDLKSYNDILAYSRTKGYDISDQYRHGGFGMITYSTSLLDKTLDIDRTSKNDIITNTGLLNNVHYREPIDDSYSHIQYWPRDHMYSTMNKSQSGSQVPYRTIRRTLAHSRMAHVTIPGNTNITVGNIVRLEIPDQNGKYSELESGRALVSRIIHNITRTEYTQDLELITDSYKRRGI